EPESAGVARHGDHEQHLRRRGQSPDPDRRQGPDHDVCLRRAEPGREHRVQRWHTPGVHLRSGHERHRASLSDRGGRRRRDDHEPDRVRLRSARARDAGDAHDRRGELCDRVSVRCFGPSIGSHVSERPADLVRLRSGRPDLLDLERRTVRGNAAGRHGHRLPTLRRGEELHARQRRAGRARLRPGRPHRELQRSRTDVRDRVRRGEPHQLHRGRGQPGEREQLRLRRARPADERDDSEQSVRLRLRRLQKPNVEDGRQRDRQLHLRHREQPHRGDHEPGRNDALLHVRRERQHDRRRRQPVRLRYARAHGAVGRRARDDHVSGERARPARAQDQRDRRPDLPLRHQGPPDRRNRSGRESAARVHLARRHPGRGDPVRRAVKNIMEQALFSLFVGLALIGLARAQTIGPILDGPFSLPILAKTTTYSGTFNGSGPALVRVQLSAPNILTTGNLVLNGATIMTAADFAGGLTQVDRSVTLIGQNSFSFTVGGTRGATVTLTVYRLIMPTPSGLAPNPLALTLGTNGTLTAALSPTPTASGTLSVSSSNVAVATVPSSIAFAANQASVSIPVTTVGSGSATITASANGGSASATVNVNAPPSVSITSPASGAIFAAPASITISASAADADGAIAKVEFFEGATLLGTATAAPYSVSLANVAAGTHTYTAKATDNLGAQTTSSAVSVVSDTPPTVSITSPATGAVFSAPASFTITA